MNIEKLDECTVAEIEAMATLIGNRVAFLLSMGDAGVSHAWRDLARLELIAEYGWVLDIDERRGSAFPWPDDCKIEADETPAEILERTGGPVFVDAPEHIPAILDTTPAPGKAINDEIADACAPFFLVFEVEITTTVPYRPYDRMEPGVGRVEVSARVSVEPRPGVDRLPDEPVETFETDHPTLTGQRVRWIHTSMYSEGKVLLFNGLAPA